MIFFVEVLIGCSFAPHWVESSQGDATWQALKASELCIQRVNLN